MRSNPQRGLESSEQAVRTARIAAAVSTATLLGLAAASELIGTRQVWGTSIAYPAGLIGIVSPVIGFRLYEWIRQNRTDASDPLDGRRRFLLGTLVALAVTEGAGLFGVIVWALSGHLIALIGLLTHVILAGAIWPGPDRLDTFEAP